MRKNSPRVKLPRAVGHPVGALPGACLARYFPFGDGCFHWKTSIGAKATGPLVPVSLQGNEYPATFPEVSSPIYNIPEAIATPPWLGICA